MSITKIRTNSISGLQNDHKAIMKEIEAGLYNYYDPDNPSSGSSSIEPMDVTYQPTTTASWVPFAKVTLVTENSPADYAVNINFIMNLGNVFFWFLMCYLHFKLILRWFYCFFFLKGLKANDLIVQFGSVKKENFRSVMDIATVVQHSEGQKLNLKVIRGDNKINTVLTPKKWQGSGLLGCSIISL